MGDALVMLAMQPCIFGSIPEANSCEKLPRRV
jgi:hypothetical protein